MLLKAGDRLVLSMILAKKHQDSIASLKILRKFREDLSFSEDEQKELELKEHEDGMITWNEEKNVGKELEVSDVINTIIKRRFHELDREKAINEDWIPVYEKFMEEKTDEKNQS